MILIKNGRMVDPESVFFGSADLLLKDGKIAKIIKKDGSKHQDFDFSAEEARDLRVIDAAGLIVGPGLVDVHVHFRDPGLTYKEDIETGAMAAKAGGYTTVVCMANTKPAVDNEETLRYVLEKGEKTGIHVLPAAAVTKGLEGRELTDMEALKSCGAAGFTDDGSPIMSQKLLFEAMKRARELNLPISLHEEDKEFIINNGINQGEVSQKLGIGGSPALAEDSLVARDCMLALHTGATLNIQHISSRNSVKLVELAKSLGADVWAEVTPHHFTLDETAVLEHGTLAKMNPPLRTKEDREALIKGLQTGAIDMIATDHAPHSAEEKGKPLTEAPSGIIGLETAFGLAVTHLVKTGRLSYVDLFRKMSRNPARLYRLEAGKLEPGQQADLMIFDENETFTAGGYYSRSSNSPFTGQTLFGKVRYTICGGKVVFEA